MNLFRSLCASALLFVPGVSALAQASPSLVPERQIHLDLTVAGAAVGFAARTSERRAFGAEIGLGGNWLNYMVLGGSHFAEEGGLSYSSKDGASSKSLLELLHATVFMRTYLSESKHLDVGAKVSGFLHHDSSDDEPGGGYFVGLNAKYSWGKWRRVNLASEMDAGIFAEPGDGTCISGCAGRQELGISVAPILVRFTFP